LNNEQVAKDDEGEQSKDLSNVPVAQKVMKVVTAVPEEDVLLDFANMNLSKSF